MLNKFQKAICSLALTSAFVGTNAFATTIGVTPSLSYVEPGDTLVLSIEGVDFPNDLDLGNFTLMWDHEVLSYTGINISNPPWDTHVITDTNVGTGLLDHVEIRDSTPGGTSPDFDIAEVTFTVVGVPDDQTIVKITEGLGAWREASTGNLPFVFYENADVHVVPIPAAAWLLMSGVLGLVGLGRRRKGKLETS